MEELLIAGVDIGGSHITVALIDPVKRMIVEESWVRMPVDSLDSAGNIIAAWSKAIRESFSLSGRTPSRLGMAMPGPFDYEKGVALMKNQNKFDALYGLNIKQLLAEQLGMKPEDIAITNDAACFLKGEVVGGAARDTNPVMGLTLGTGLGTSRCINGKAEDANLWCAPFKEAQAEDYLSTRWFVRRYAELTQKSVRDVKALVEQQETDRCINQLFHEFGTNLGEFLAPYIAAEGTKLIVLGNITLSYSLFSSALRQAFDQRGLPVKVAISQLGENAALMGAASYC